MEDVIGSIPQEVRVRLGLLPHTEVEFEVVGDHARIRKTKRSGNVGSRGGRVLSSDTCGTPRGLIPRLASSFSVIAPDYPGFGLSSMPDHASFRLKVPLLTAAT
jgi:hypothetical protein